MRRSFDLYFGAAVASQRLQLVVMAVLLLVSIALAFSSWRLHQELLAEEQRQEQLHLQLRQLVFQRAAATDTVSGLSDTVSARLAVPWGALLDTLARTTPSSMQVTHLTPDASYRMLQWSIETDTLDPVPGYLKTLNNSGVLRNVHMTEQARPDPVVVSYEQQPLSPVRAWKITFRGEWLMPVSAVVPVGASL